MPTPPRTLRKILSGFARRLRIFAKLFDADPWIGSSAWSSFAALVRGTGKRANKQTVRLNVEQLEPRLNPSVPTVMTVSPTSGPPSGGTIVSITGSNFTGTTVVDFGTVAATSYSVMSDTSIDATAPAEAAGTVDIEVTNGSGTSMAGTQDHYTFASVPTITGVSPNQGPTTGGQTVTITGTGLSGVTEVYFGAFMVSPTVDSSTQITATSPPYASATTVDITVQSAAGTSATSSADRYTYGSATVNHAPVGTNNTLTTLENTAYTLAVGDFGFTDPNDSPANNFQAVEITTLPSAGTLADRGAAVTAREFIGVSDVSGGQLVFTPANNGHGSPYASFTFQVQDDGGTANGGVNTDTTARTMTVDVTGVNHAPVGTAHTVTARENIGYVFAAADFGFTDPNDSPANNFQAVEITTVPSAGTLSDSGISVTPGTFVGIGDITAGRLAFTPAAYALGTAYASFTFQVQDDGGTANGGVDTDPSPKTMTLNVAWVNQAPSGTAKTVTTPENTPYDFATADFGFTDPHDAPANNFKSAEITTLPSAGTLTDNGVAVTAGTFVSVGDIGAGRLVFTPVNYAYGTNYANFAFQVQDDGGTANGGVDTDPAPKTMTLNVTWNNINWVNHAPVGTPNTVTTAENIAYPFALADFGFSDPHDSPANNFKAVKIPTLPSAGTLTDSGAAVTAGTFVPVGDIGAGRLIFTPTANAYGTAYASFTFQVQDDGGTANGGVDTDTSPRTMTLNVGRVNHAPLGTVNTVTTRENIGYVFATADFGFSDPHDTPANNFKAVKIATLPNVGSLTASGVAVTAGTFVSVSDITAGQLILTPANYGHGSGYASFTFQVQDDGGTAYGGADTDPSPKSMTLNVTWVNQAPVGTAKALTMLEGAAHTFVTADFGFSDPHDAPANNFKAVEITTLPSAGTLSDSGVAVTAGTLVVVGDISAGHLVFTPAAYAYGTAYASFTFQVQDDGGTANGGVDTDPTPKTMTLNVTGVNHAPVGTAGAATMLENAAHTFVTADFGFTDPHDSPANNFQAVKITTLPSVGTLRDNGTAVTAGTFVSASDIGAGRLVFTPANYGHGLDYASFTFQVQDDGGTANGGVDTDPSPKTMTLNVTWVNQAPVGTAGAATMLENGAHTFVTADFGFTDPHDAPANNLQAVEITTVPSAGTLSDSGTAVAAGTFVRVGDISAGNLVFTPATYGQGSDYASFTFQVQDDGGTANGGADTDPVPKTMTLDVGKANQAPVGTSNTLNVLENAAHTFAAADFGFTDPNDSPANNFKAVEITTVPSAGTLSDSGTTVTAGSFVSVSDINGDHLVFTPTVYTYGTACASFTFQVQDDGGTANGGVDTDPVPKTMTFNVTRVNQAPVGAVNTVTTLENIGYVFATADFGFSDPHDTPANNFKAVKIATLPNVGSLTDSGAAVAAGTLVSVNDINAGALVFTPANHGHGSAYAAFTFQVQDDGGTANGGIDTDPTPKSMTVNVTWVNQAPVGTAKTVTTPENIGYVFATGDFGFTDPHDAPANNFKAVEITALPTTGTLTDSGTAVAAGTFVSVSDIGAGNLVFSPAASEEGTPYAAFTFQVQDDGGTANGGADTDPSPKTMTLNVADQQLTTLASANLPSSGQENIAVGAIAGIATFTDPAGPEALGDYTATVNWGDGATSPGTIVALSGNNFRIDAPAHTYAEEATYRVNVTLTHDLLAALTTPNQTIVIADPQLTSLASANLPGNGQENVGIGAITGIATFTDPAGAEAIADYTATVNWGDGTTSPGTIVALSGSNFQVNAPAHTYADEATYTVTVGLNHDALGTATTPAQTIVIADPQLTALASANLPSSGNEGASTGAIAGIATFTDPAGVGAETAESDYTATVNWGDGTTSPGTVVALSGGNYRVDAPAHTYAEETTYTVNVTLQHDLLTALTTPNQTIVIADQQLTALASANLPSTGNEGASIGAIAGIATFTDPAGVGAESAGSDYTATVNWGDGTTSPGSIVALSGGNYRVDAPAHNYAAETTYTVNVTLQHDLLTALTTPNQTIVVADQQLTSLASANLPGNGQENVAIGAIAGIATFTDPAGPEALADYSATVNWGDGTTSPGTIVALSGGNFQVNAPAHTYADQATYTVTVGLNHDALATVNTPAQTIVIADQQLTALASANLPSSGQENVAVGAIAGVATFTDPAGPESLGDYTATVNWGDGTTSPGTIVALSGDNFQVNAPAHTYVDEATYAVTVGLNHDALATVTTPAQTIVVADQQLTTLASANLTGSGQENVVIGAITGIATFTDPAGAEAIADYTATVNWGDGATSPGTVVALSGGNFRVDAPVHTYAEESTYTVNVTLGHDLLTALTTPNQTIVIADQQLTSLASANLPSSGQENVAVSAITGIATFTDPAGPEALGDYTATVNWGDGATSPGTIVALSGDNFRVDAPAHTYAEEATYAVTVGLSHDALATVTTSAQTIVVADQQLTSLASANLPSGGHENIAIGAITGIATFTDPAGPEALADYTANINWGDGTSSPGTIVALSGDNFRVDAPTHTYTQQATYTVTAGLKHDALATVTTPAQTIVITWDVMWNGPTGTWTMNPVPNPTIVTPSAQTNTEADAVSLAIAASDPGGYTLSYDAVNLPIGLSINASTGVISGTVDYAAAEDFGGAYDTTVVASDSQGGSASTEFPWTIIDLPRAAVLTNPGDQTNAAGDTVSLQVAASDADGNQLTYDASGLPSGLSIDSSSGLISGTIDPTAGAAAPYAVTVTVNDGNGSVSQNLNWTVNAVAQAPSLAGPGDQIDALGDQVSLVLSAGDADGDTLTYTATGLPAGLSIDPGSGIISGTIATSNVTNSPYPITATVSDGAFYSSQSFSWTIYHTGITNPGLLSNVAGDVVSLQIAGTSVGSTLTYTATGLPAGLSIDASTGLISGTLGATTDTASPYGPTVTAHGGGDSATAVFGWIVTDMSLANPGNQVNRDGSWASLQLAAVDADGDALAYSATGLPAGLSLNASSGQLTGMLGSSAHLSSPYQVTFTASDGGHSVSQSLIWTVTPEIAIANPGTQVAAAGDTVSLQIQAADSTPSTLSYSATGLPSGLSINASSGLISGTIPTSAAPSYTVVVTASDGMFSSNSQAFLWTVAPLVLPAPADQSNLDGDSVSLSAAAHYHGVGSLTYSATGLPTGVSINAGTGLISGTVGTSADAAGPYFVNVTVTDGTATATQKFNWTIEPVVTVTSLDDQVGVAGDAVSLAVSANDALSNALTYSASGLPSGLAIDATTGLISGTIALTAASSTPYAVTVTAQDAAASGVATFNWTVSPLALANPGPVVTASDGMFSSNSQAFLWTVAPLVLPAPADQSNLDGDSVSLSAAAHYHGVGSLTYSATGLPTGVSINAGTGLISGTVGTSADAAGPYFVNVTVTDGTATATQKFNWTIEPVVTVTSLDDQVGVAGDAVSLAVSANDALSNALTYSASGLPSGLAIDATTGLISGTIALTAASSTPYAVTVTAQDAAASGVATFNWTVSPLALANPGPLNNVDGQAVSLALAVDENDGDTLTFSATNLPPGLSINASTGVISGNLSATADQGSGYLTTETVSDGTNSATEDFQWNVSKIGAVNPGAQTNQEGDTVSLMIQAAGISGTPTFSASGLPAGLSINASTGVIAGTIQAGATGSFTVVVAVSNGTLASQQSFTWTVTPVVNVATIANQSNNEGDAVSIQPSATDAKSATVTWSASGLPAGLSINASTGAITGRLNYDDANAGPDYAVTVTASDALYSGSQTFNFHVVNSIIMAPTLTNPGAQGNQAGDNVDFFLATSNTNGDTLTFSETGLPDGLSLDPNSGEITGTVADDAVTSTPYDVVATVDNGQGGTATQTFSWIINSPPISATSGGAISAIEGQDTGPLTITTFTTPDQNATSDAFTAVVYWGDGTSDIGDLTGSNGVFTVSDDHYYGTPGTYSVSVLISASTGATSTATFTATVDDAPITATGGYQLGAILNQSTTLAVATFTDGNPYSSPSSFTVSVNWGDGSSSSTVTPIAAANGIYRISSPHTYAADGSYTAVITITDVNGATTSATSSVVVGDLYAGTPGKLTLVSFTDSNSNATAGDFSASINWGDGSTLGSGAVTKSAGVFSITANHTYGTDSLDESGGVYQVAVTVTDGDGNSLTKNLTVEVVRPPLALTVANVHAQPGVTLAGVSLATLTDSDILDTSAEFSVAVNWGDGSGVDTSPLITGSLGLYQIAGTHTYANPGEYVLNVSVSEAWSTKILAESGSGTVVVAQDSAPTHSQLAQVIYRNFNIWAKLIPGLFKAADTVISPAETEQLFTVGNNANNKVNAIDKGYEDTLGKPNDYIQQAAAIATLAGPYLNVGPLLSKVIKSGQIVLAAESIDADLLGSISKNDLFALDTDVTKKGSNGAALEATYLMNLATIRKILANGKQLWNINTAPNPDLLHQGRVQDCHFMASVISLAKNNPDVITGNAAKDIRPLFTRITKSASGRITGATVNWPSGAKATTVTVTLPELGYYGFSEDGMWGSLIDKAFVQLRGATFKTIVLDLFTNKGDVLWPAVTLLSPSKQKATTTAWLSVTPPDPNTFFTTVAKAIKAGHMVTAGVFDIRLGVLRPDDNLPNYHAYAVYNIISGPDTEKPGVGAEIVLRNPWGLKDGKNEWFDSGIFYPGTVYWGTFQMPLTQFFNGYVAVAIEK